MLVSLACERRQLLTAFAICERNDLSNIRTAGVDYQEFIEFGFLSWIANAHDMRGEYSKACQFYEESLQINISKKRKESKKETALTLNRLGSLNRELGRYEEVSHCCSTCSQMS